ncbi:translation elongation factor Ts [Aliarcobacter butzleri]|uniref:Elongation factor Ts n=6 Tax=Aliarcobacter butzleri TaxID=28197 RepID=EFTS_ALIB4|nr:translation elongation factor Ts [Aliarcobacter butzleri]A8ES84.1 RecName: Full=Elongation factor Ts; Short=EF-Ts [Aliarcobacter butzleri RM4018]ABV66808.1 translation elongation factor EF-Ts [Aliarcobacter butzleri RM4018]AGR76870.1 translation elongation factor EF-Ts [Aliarcobacter butzleri 7h1h]EFU70430.1 elongation factor EF1B [Aliarcobacter butzleri JV22]KLD96049.1 elongation factor Ts [Aliarcobacter butzleri L348]KLE00656.1 elongation factor Ts [Aliarcobacter butzleri L351]
MAGVTPQLIKELREMTGAGMMDCKNALNETNGDLDKAVQALREAGLGKAAKKAGNVAAEGLISVLVNSDNTKAVLLELNSQTDFVAKNENFVNLTKEITTHALNNGIADAQTLASSKINGEEFQTYLNEKIATIGENLVARKLSLVSGQVVNGYVHATGRVGVVLAATCNDAVKDKAAALLRNIAMHASAMKPTVISYKDLDPAFVESENKAIRAEIEAENDELRRLGKPQKRIPEFVSKSQLTDEAIAAAKARFEDELKAQGKPEKIWANIIPGQIERFIADNTQLDGRFALLSQPYVMDDKKTVEQAIAEVDSSIVITEYIRFELGEGIEKKEEDFAAEVAKQMGK